MRQAPRFGSGLHSKLRRAGIVTIGSCVLTLLGPPPRPASAATPASALAAFRIPFGAVEAGRGGAGLAAPGDGTDFLRNAALPAFFHTSPDPLSPAALTSSPHHLRLHIAHTAWLFDASLNHLAASSTLGSGQLSLAIQTVAYGALERRGELPTTKPDGSFDPSDAAAALSFSHPVGLFGLSRLGPTTAGITLRGFTQILDTDRASGYSLDFGLYQEVTTLPLAAGLSLRHLGPAYGPGDDPLPLTLGAGLRIHPQLINIPTALLFDALWTRGAPNQLLAGLEIRPTSILGLRAGKNIGVDAEGLSWGLDLLLPAANLRFAYAFTAAAYNLDGAHRFDLTLFL